MGTTDSPRALERTAVDAMTVDARDWTVPDGPSAAVRDSLPLYGLALWLGLVQISIAASHIVLGALVLYWLHLVARRELRLVSLPYDAPFASYAGLSLGAAVFSLDPGASLPASKELLLLVVPYLVVSIVRRPESLEKLVLVLVVVADVGALVGLWQYRFGELGDLNHRIRGFMSHYMTYSGLLMGVGVLALAGFLFSRPGARRRWFLLGSFLLIGVALTLTLTRSAWIGTLVAAIVLLALKDRRLVALAPVAAVAASLLVPADVERRLFSLVHPDTSGWDRLYMLQAGAGMVRAHPLLGVGPEMVAEVYPIYVASDARRRDNPHLHNNLAQIAAERGILCLGAWLWFVGLSVTRSVGEIRMNHDDGTPRALATGALGVILAGFVSGLFEYNFGDSEFQMLFLFVMSVPLVLEHHRRSHQASAS